MRLRDLFFLPLPVTLLLAGCVKGNRDFKEAHKAELLQDYDTALVHYERALRSDPGNADFKLQVARLRFEAGQFHVQQGHKLVATGDLQAALAEFQKAQAIDPASPIADQESRRTLEMIAAVERGTQPAPPPTAPEHPPLLSMPPQLKPISTERINLKMTNDAKVVYETIAKLAGLTVLFDPDFTSKKITADLPNVTLEQALNAAALESKSFWKPVTSNIIFVAADQPQKRRDYEDEVVRTFYLANTLTPQDLTEVVTGLRQLLDLRRVQQINAQNAIVIRDTPDKLAVAQKILYDVDQVRPEIVLQVSVLQVNLDRLRDLGVNPGTSAVLQFTPRPVVQPGTSSSSSSGSSSSSSTSTATQITLNNLRRLSTGDYSATLPGASATFLLTDSHTHIIQNPEIRVTDGQTAKLRIGDRVPVATGSFQAGVGVGVGTAGAGVVNPLVNTQFQYQDVGVNIDVTPRVHPNQEVSLKLDVEVSSVTGTRSIGGIDQPVISQRKIEHNIRLKEGEVSILGGLIQSTDTKSLQGWPGLARIPFFRYFFSENKVEHQDQEVLIVLTPRVVRKTTITAENLKSIAAGTDTNVQVYAAEPGTTGTVTPVAQPEQPSPPPAQPPAAAVVPQPGTATPQPATPTPQQPGAPPAQAPQTGPAARLRFDPASITLHPGETATLGLAIENARDLFSIPLLLQYDPTVIQVQEVRNGGFLSGGTEEIAIVQRIDTAKGQAVVSATRQPNTPGISGTGTLLGIVIKAMAPGNSTLEVLQVNARDSQQKPLTLVAGVASIHVEGKP